MTTTVTRTHELRFQTKDPLVRGLTNTMLFAAKDDLPFLATVRFEFDGEKLLLVSTDRYRLCIENVARQLPGEKNDVPACEPFTALLQIRDVKSIIAVLRGVNRADSVTLTYDDETKRMRLIAGYEGSTSEYRVDVDSNFPAWRQLVPDPKEGVKVDEIGFNPAFLADLGKVKTDRRLTFVRVRLYGNGKVTRTDFEGGPTVLLVATKLNASAPDATDPDSWGAGV